MIIPIAVIAIALLLTFWISWKLLFASVMGNAIRVGPLQYPHIQKMVTEASEVLDVNPPTAFVLQGNGLFEKFVAKMFSRHGMPIITTNVLDDLTERGPSRELIFFLGRQLGLIATGFFRFWAIKHVLGLFSFSPNTLGSSGVIARPIELGCS